MDFVLNNGAKMLLLKLTPKESPAKWVLDQ